MKIARWRIALTGSAVLVLAVAGIGLASAAHPAPSTARPAGAAAPASTDVAGAAALDTAAALDIAAALDVAGAPDAAPGTLDAADLEALLAPELAAGQAGQVAARLRPRLGPRVVHAEWIVDRGDAGLVTRQLDRGTVATTAGSSLAVAEAGGRSVTIATTDATRVRRNRAKAALTDLKVGDTVVVLSTVAGGKATANVIVVPAPGPAASVAPSSAP